MNNGAWIGHGAPNLSSRPPNTDQSEVYKPSQPARLSASLHSSLGSFLSSASLTGFLHSGTDASPSQTWPVYVDAQRNALIILDAVYSIAHALAFSSPIRHISCSQMQVSVSTQTDVRVVSKLGNELRTVCVLEEQNTCCSCLFGQDTARGLCIAKEDELLLFA